MNSISIWEIFKSLFDYTQAFITKKPGPVIIYITLLLIFVVADNYLPMNLVFVSVFASIFWNILSNAFLINVGHIVKDNKDIISFEKALKQRNTIDFFTQYWKESLGMMFGNAVVFFIIFLGEALVLNFSGFITAYYATKIMTSLL
jgi:hypothetical protein